MSILHIAWRELRQIFNTAVGWIVLFGYLLISGVFWASMVSFYGLQSTEMAASPYGGPVMNFADHLLAPYFGNISIILLLVVPAVAMRLFSEEFRQQTMPLLFTAPISTLEIVAGKFLGAVGFVASMLVATAYVPLTLVFWGEVDWGVVFGGYLSLLLLGSTIISIGMLYSSMTKNQIVAVVLCFATAMALWVLSWVSTDPDSLFSTLAVSTHLMNLSRGAVQLTDLVYFAGLIGFFFFATYQRVDSIRWR